MAPPKKKDDGKGKGKGKAVATTSTRVTRSMDRKTRSGSSSSSSSSSKLMKFDSPEKKKRKTTKGDKGGAKKKIKKEEEEYEAVEIKKEKESTEELTDENEVAEEADSVPKKIVIEYCKQCDSFKTRATEVKEGLEKAVPGILVTVNPKKPRRGCFEIREEGGDKFISLLNMKPPFKAMKDLVMEEVIANIVEKIK